MIITDQESDAEAAKFDVLIQELGLNNKVEKVLPRMPKLKALAE